MILAAAVEEGREVFLGFGTSTVITFYLLSLAATVVFIYGFWRRLGKYRRGRGVGRFSLKRFVRGVADIASQRTVGERNRAVGVAHFFVFWGFVVLLVGTAIIAVDEDVIGWMLDKPQWQFWHGVFYVGYALVLDVFGIGFIVGLLYLARRRRSAPQRLDYARVDRAEPEYDRHGYALDDRIFLLILLLLGASGFLLEGLRLASIDFPSFERVSVAGYAVGLAFSWLGDRGGDLARIGTWWAHAGAALAFVAYIPYSKAMHMVLDVAGLVFTDQDSARSLPPVEDPASPGYTSLASFSWKELLDFDVCTKCGRCHEVCPARASGSPLSPRDLVLDLREYADSHNAMKLWYGAGARPSAFDGAEVSGGVIASATLWSCTTCMACMEACPVGIEHVPTIVQMRRRLVDTGDVEPGLQSAFEALARTGNSFGKSAKQRARWTRGLDSKPKDVREEPAEYLWFVGDFASFDPRAVEVTATVARLLERSGVDFGLLYDGERNSGNDVRRAGEEGLFEMLRDQNEQSLRDGGFDKVFTTDPHSLNTLRNEYPGRWPVQHYSELLAGLVDSGRLTPRSLGGKATYHDPCYLGRYAEEYEAPRRLIAAVGLDLVEMGRCRENSFCCGAGGGRIWMDDSDLDERPSQARIREALALGDDVRYFVVACPKDMVMYSDAVKSTGNEDRLEVVDIAQLLERALAPAEAPVG